MIQRLIYSLFVFLVFSSSLFSLAVSQEEALLKPTESHFMPLPAHSPGETAAINSKEEGLIFSSTLSVLKTTPILQLSIIIEAGAPLHLILDTFVMFNEEGEQIQPLSFSGIHDLQVKEKTLVSLDFDTERLGKLSECRLLIAPMSINKPFSIFALENQRFSTTTTKPQEKVPNFSNPKRSTTGYPKGDPWKALVIIYPNLVWSNATTTITTVFPATEQAGMRTAFEKLLNKGIIYSYSGNEVDMEAHFVVASRTLTSLAAIGTGYWPSPAITKTELDLYAPVGLYDSVFIWWSRCDADNHCIPNYSWGVGYWPNSLANYMTYAAAYSISWIWQSYVCNHEIFLHNWLAGVIGWYQNLGFSSLPGINSGGTYGYVADVNGCWIPWYQDYMKGLVSGNFGLIPATWESGSITTHGKTSWRGEFFTNTDLTDNAWMVMYNDTLSTSFSFNWGTNTPHPVMPVGAWSASFKRNFSLPAGLYHFTINYEGKASLVVDNVLSVGQWTSFTNGAIIADETFNSAGIHWITVNYAYSGSGNAQVSLTTCKATTTCATLGLSCGSIGDNCGFTQTCGTCSPSATCYNGACCVPKTCSELGIVCRSSTDNCGNPLDCFVCSGQDVCNNGACCTPKTCLDIGVSCGTWDDSCGNTLNCGNCIDSVCNNGTCCTPRTCDGMTCGTIDDNCGNSINCGNCTGSHNCYNGLCCTPKTCANLGVSCGTWNDYCGNPLDCGSCINGYCNIEGVCINNQISSSSKISAIKQEAVVVVIEFDTEITDVTELQNEIATILGINVNEISVIQISSTEIQVIISGQSLSDIQANADTLINQINDGTITGGLLRNAIDAHISGNEQSHLLSFTPAYHPNFFLFNLLLLAIAHF